MQRRKRVGGITDRRFGENDPKMAPEEKALERFVKERQRGSKKNSIFDLEDDEKGVELTHLGRSLASEHVPLHDDYNEAGIHDHDEEDLDGLSNERLSKRRKISKDTKSRDGSPVENEALPSDQRKTKKEVMEEVIAKSKLHKYERQQAREDNDDLRAELDKGLPDLFALMSGPQRRVQDNRIMNPDRMALLSGTQRPQSDREYDKRLRQMAMSERARPTSRTLTDDEKLHKEAHRLKELEERRLRRMQGEQEGSGADFGKVDQDSETNDEANDVDSFGLGTGLPARYSREESGVEDEDDFFMDDDLISDEGRTDLSDNDDSSSHTNSSDKELSDNEDDQEFVQGLLSKEDQGREGLAATIARNGEPKTGDPVGILAYTYKCPENHEELLKMTTNIAIKDLPTVVQRIRALYHPKLGSENKAKLGNLARSLTDHISYMANQAEHPPLTILESLIRHLHSLAKTFPGEVGSAVRSHLKSMHERPSIALTPGDLIILTAVATVFPTSDHFHPVVTPAMLSMGWYLSQKVPISLSDLATGTYVITLILHYQRLSRRYVPEAVNYILNALFALAPRNPSKLPEVLSCHNLPESFRIRSSVGISSSENLDFWAIVPSTDEADSNNQALKLALLKTQIEVVENMLVLWADIPAFCEIFDSFHRALSFLGDAVGPTKFDDTLKDKINTAKTHVHTYLCRSLAARKPLRLHNHRPLAIKTSVPKFEESYNPDRHYDFDRDRAEVAKLKAEHKRERKGALRELRKDGNFIARENLREKKERDSAYEKKYKRLISEIQGEEGREAKTYEREKRLRKSKK